MTRRPLMACFTVITAAISSGCIMIGGNIETVRGSGNVEESVRTVEVFDSIRLKGSADVEVEVGQPLSVVVKADDNLLERIRTEVEGDTLVISTKGRFRSKAGIMVTVGVPSLDDVSLVGSGDMTVRGVNGDLFEVSLSGSGDLEARGQVGRVEASLQGSGDIILDNLVSEHAKASLMGSGDIDIHATQTLVAKIFGSGDINYYGDPADVDRSVFGSGDIDRH